MSTPSQQPTLGALLQNLVEDIDVPDGKYADAQERYRAVGEWLGAVGSALAGYGVSVYPQGSFALGTVIKPPDGEDYDVDAVCLLKTPPAWTQQQLKAAVGDRLREHQKYKAMLKPPNGKRRCWRLQYADGSNFHLDILPARPDQWQWLLQAGVDERFAKHAVQITCSDSYADAQWPKSNPQGYRQWFIERMRTRFDEERRRIALSKRADVQAVPDFEVRTPLQRVVQILKRQRDTMFGDDPDKPISIIITTLAAMAYSNENELESAYRGIVRKLRTHALRGGHFAILNPVNPRENFADRWAQRPALSERFAEWLEAVESTEQQLAPGASFEKRAEVLTESFGASGTRAVRASLPAGSPAEPTLVQEAFALSRGLPAVDAASHRQSPPWRVVPQYNASISARSAKRNGFRTAQFSDRSPSAPLPKEMDLWFTLSTDTPAPFEVFWQVVNTGTEAATVAQLRGGFDRGEVKHKEVTRYRGTHSVQAFVVKNGQCVAQSRRAIVNIR